MLPGATRTALWEAAGVDVDSLPPEMVMGAQEMVDAALAGLDAGELVTILTARRRRLGKALDAARLALGPSCRASSPRSVTCAPTFPYLANT